MSETKIFKAVITYSQTWVTERSMADHIEWMHEQGDYPITNLEEVESLDRDPIYTAETIHKAWHDWLVLSCDAIRMDDAEPHPDEAVTTYCTYKEIE